MQPFTRECLTCHRHRDADELFTDDNATTCLLCVRKAERKAEGRLHTSQRQIVARQKRPKLTPANKYRRNLTNAGYMPEQVEAYVCQRFPEDEPA